MSEQLEELKEQEYISASQINSYLNCASRYAHERMMRGQKIISKATMATLGDAIHTCIAELSKIAMKDFQGRCYLFQEEDVINHWKKTIARYPALVDNDNIKRGAAQLRYWLKQEIYREAVVLECEKSELIYLPNGLAINVIIDRVEKNKFCEGDQVQLIDWKTGFLKDDYTRQMTLYKIAGCLLWKEAKGNFLVTVVHLENEYCEHYNITKEDLQEYYDFILIVKQAISNFIQKINEFIKDGDLAGLNAFLDAHCNVNKYCYSCSRANACRPYVLRVQGLAPFLPKDEEGNVTLEGMINKYEHIKAIQKGMDETLKALDEVIMDEMVKAGMKPLKLSDGRWLSTTTRSFEKIDPKVVIPILIKNGCESILSVPTARLKEIVDALPEGDRQAIRDKGINKVKSAPYWRVTKSEPKGK